MKIKICGLFREEDIRSANTVRPDYIGFVFAESRRRISPAQAQRFRKLLHPAVRAVGVFADAPSDEIIRSLDKGIIDMVQLHGNEGREDIRRIQEATGKKVIKAVKVYSRADVECQLDSPADYLLFDSGQGTGQTFAWDIVEDIGIKRDFFLAGGISAENIEEACQRVRPYCIDVSSGAEVNGLKDRERMHSLTRALRAYTGSR